jgi:predicted nucleotidyltransferase component of viral defense system
MLLGFAESTVAKNKKLRAAEELKWREEIKKLVIIAMFSDDEFLERLVLKGGNALDLVHHVSTRASADIDLSIDGDFSPEVRAALRDRIEKLLRTTFRQKRYHVFDVRLEEKPAQVSAELKAFWGGYRVEFKLIELKRYEELKDDPVALSKNALQLGQGAKFLIDISKHEYTVGKAAYELDGYVVPGYTAEMIVCEKLRAV